MISTKKLIKLARKWQKLAAIRQKRIMSTIFKGDDAEKCYVKGHFVVYTVDHKRFVLPLVYLSNNVVQALMELAEEFGLPTNGPLTVLCDTAFMEYVVTLISHNVNEDAERPLLTLIAGSHCASFS
ncbi:auxin-responsive protein SAUR63-like [Citrus sinensis]|uniref:auxin-responsive protein SAUR63-like n=1 Tax=Citrus sinensis TaxID=2711 RepID=UPI000CED579A|nr:auxin-responsive protein SAUR63-like [Citrus sinensis]XP_024034788.1 auxin-responsive protein SAUR63 [Citrus x clementina]